MQMDIPICANHPPFPQGEGWCLSHTIRPGTTDTHGRTDAVNGSANNPWYALMQFALHLAFPRCISSRLDVLRRVRSWSSTPRHRYFVPPGKQRKERDSDYGPESRLCRFKLEGKTSCLSLSWLHGGRVCSLSPQRRPPRTPVTPQNRPRQRARSTAESFYAPR
jgi:hypothetical protein